MPDESPREPDADEQHEEPEPEPGAESAPASADPVDDQVGQDEQVARIEQDEHIAPIELAPRTEDDVSTSVDVPAEAASDADAEQADPVDSEAQTDSAERAEPAQREERSATQAEGVVAVAATPRSSRPDGARTSRSAAGSSARRSIGSLRGRFGREAIGIAVLVVLALICAGLIAAVVVKTRNDAAVAAREAAAYTPPPLSTPTPAATGPMIAVIGDGTAVEASSGVSDAGRWPALLAADLDGTANPSTSEGMGYATNGASGQTFGDEAAAIPSDTDVVVFFGGTADANVASLSIARAAAEAFASAAQRAPRATILVVGPVIRGGASSTSVTELRTTLRNAAKIAKVTWVDPIGSGWLSDARTGASSPTALTADDERVIATKLAAAVTRATD